MLPLFPRFLRSERRPLRVGWRLVRLAALAASLALVSGAAVAQPGENDAPRSTPLEQTDPVQQPPSPGESESDASEPGPSEEPTSDVEDAEDDAARESETQETDTQETEAQESEAQESEAPAPEAPDGESPASDPADEVSEDERAEQPAIDDEPAEATDSEPATVVDDAPEASLDDDTIVLRLGEEVAWRWRAAPAAGAATEPRLDGDVVRFGHGIYLLTVAVEDGTVVARRALPAPAERIEGEDDDAVVIVRHDDGSETSLPLADEAVAGPVLFGTTTDAFAALARAASRADDPAAAADRDPTDPWLALRAGLESDDADERDARLDDAVEAASALPFFESAQLAHALLAAGEDDRFELAMEAALDDVAERGYDPRLVTDPELRSAYGFPHDALLEALDAGDLARAELLAPYAWLLASEEAPETVEAIERLAGELRASGEGPEADLWRARARDLQRAGLTTWIDGVAIALARLGWAGVASLLGAMVLVWLVLLAKVWRAQTLARRQRRERGQASSPFARLWVPRHASTTEKAVLVVLLILAGFQASLAGWHGGDAHLSAALRSGTLASDAARAEVAELPDEPYAELVRGLSYAQQDRLDDAVAAWRAAGDLAPALVNLAVAAEAGPERDALVEAALRADPREPVARFLAGRDDDPSPFHAKVAGDAPLWSVPSPLELRLASAGDWRGALRTAAVAPWRALPEARPAAVPAWGWWTLFLLYGALLLILTAFVFLPRPRVSRDAPRTPAYHLLALLVPGSGHADELWGLLLLVPWSLIGIDAALAGPGGDTLLGLPLGVEIWILVGIWTINTIGFAVEASSYRRRMWLLRERKPELARSYGLPPTPPPPEA